MKKRVAGWYRRMKIKDKLFVFLSLIMAVSFLFVYSGVQYAFHVYDEQIYRKSSEVLRMSSERIEDELKKIEDVSYEIITDEQIQRILSMQNRDDTYDQYQMKQELWDQLAGYASDEKYIDSIHVIDARGSEYSAGSSSSAVLNSAGGISLIYLLIRREPLNTMMKPCLLKEQKPLTFVPCAVRNFAA